MKLLLAGAREQLLPVALEAKHQRATSEPSGEAQERAVLEEATQSRVRCCP